GKSLLQVGPNQFIAVQDRDAANQDKPKTTQWELQANSRVGATVKGDMLEARFEFSVTSDESGGNVGTRRLYGIWKFTEGWGLKVGKDYTPITFFLSGQVFDNDAGLLNVGNAYGSRRAQLALEGKLGPGMLKVALIDTTTNNLGTPDSVTETLIPKLEASYQFNLSDTMSMHAFGGYQTYDIKTAQTPLGTGATPLTGTESTSVNSWMLGLGADLNFGPFFVKPQVSYYQNGAAAGWLGDQYLTPTKRGFITGINASAGTDFDTNVISTDVLDGKNLMAMLALGFKATEALGLEFGVGYVGFDTDSVEGISIKNNYMEYYLQAVFTMAPGVYIVPEIGYRDFGKDEGDRPPFSVAPDTDNGSLFYAGAKWQIDF
ncbi:MAG: hypothetical protein WBM78_07530, partial [Desulfobacterales bacterium]